MARGYLPRPCAAMLRAAPSTKLLSRLLTSHIHAATVFGGGELGPGCLLNLGAHSRRPPSEGADATCPNPPPRSRVARADRASIAEKLLSRACARGEPRAVGDHGVEARPNLVPT